MRNCLEYVLREGKAGEGLVCVTGPYPEDTYSYDQVYQAFMQEKWIWNKDSGRMYAHNVISWHKDESITSEQAFEFGKDFAEKWFDGFQTVVAVHKDKDHIHCHLVTNSVSYENGRKLHTSRKDLEQMKAFTNKMCQERGLSVAQKGKHFDGSRMEEGSITAWSKDKYNLFTGNAKDSFLMECGIAVLSTMEDCASREEFIWKLAEKGWKVNWTENRKHITFENKEGKKVRDSNLSKTFQLKINKEDLENEFKRCYERRETERLSDDGITGKSESDFNRQFRNGGSEDRGTDWYVYKGQDTVPAVSGEDENTQRGDTDDFLRKSRAENDAVRNAELESRAEQEQRRAEEQKRSDAQRAARTARKRSKKHTGPEL